MKTVLFIPGYQEDIDTRDYTSTIKAIERQGYNVIFVPISWKRTTIDDWVKELELVYSNHDPAQTILAGFSFGAMTAFVAATRRNPSELWLFSLSPYFHEDINSKTMRQAWLKLIGKNRTASFNKLNFAELADTIRCKTLLFCGQKELDKWPDMNKRAIQAQKLIKNSRLIPVEGVGHDVANKLYIDAITKQLSS